MPNNQDIGGWPKIIDADPSRPHELWEGDESDEPHDISFHSQSGYELTGSIYFVFEVFKRFHSLDLYPPRWALNALVEKIEKHLKNPDPDMFASQFAVTARGSGSQSPYESYMWRVERLEVLGDMSVLFGGFDISLIDAAKAMIEKRNLLITPKRLVNEFRDIFVDTKRLKYKNLDIVPFFDEEGTDTYISEFPRRALRFIKDKKPRLKLGGLEDDSPAKT